MFGENISQKLVLLRKELIYLSIIEADYFKTISWFLKYLGENFLKYTIIYAYIGKKTYRI